MRLVRAGLAFFAFAVLLVGQTDSDSGGIDGVITDPSGAPIAHARISVTDDIRGETRGLETDAAGTYRATALQPGIYTVRVEAAGFAVKNVEGVEVRLGDTVSVRSVMEVGTLRTEVTATAEVPSLDAGRTQQADAVSWRNIRELPVNNRNYLGLAFTTPGVTRTDSIVGGSDSRGAQAGLSFGGGNGRGNAFLVDGTENYSNSGGVRPSVSQEAVEEFQVNRSGFTAEFGNTTGGVLNTVTRSGGNATHGDAFGFLRDSDLAARNFFDLDKPSYTRGEYGATLGGPIRKDHTFYFAAFERRDRHQTALLSSETNAAAFHDLSSSQQALVTYLEGAPKTTLQSLGQKLQSALVPANSSFVMNTFAANSGDFPFSEANDTGSVRVDHRFSDKELFFFRGNISQGDNQIVPLGGLAGYNRGSNSDVLAGAAMLSNTYIFNPQWIGESRLMFGYDGVRVVPNDPNGPQIDVEGYGSFGRSVFLPSTSFERHYELIQNFSHTTGRHAIKFGVDINPVSDTVAADTFFGGRFQFGPGVSLGQVINLLARNSSASTSLSSQLTASGQTALAASLGDSISSLQAFALGIPLYYQQGFGNPNWSGTSGRYGMFVQDSWKAAANFNINIGLRYDVETNPRPVSDQVRNFGPRFGFSYAPFHDGKTVIRGGFGLFYGRIDVQAANLASTLNGSQISQVFVTAKGQPTVINPLTGLPVSSVNVWHTLMTQGVIGQGPITLGDIVQFGLAPGPNSADRVLFGIDRNFRSPYTQQMSFEIQHAFGELAVSASYEFNRGVHEARTLDENLYYTGRLANGQPTFGFLNPDVLQNNVIQSTANSWYNALTVQVVKRYSKHLTLDAHYTFSKAEDEATDFNSDFEPNDQLNARAEKALSSYDQRHRFVASAVWELRNWTIAPIFEAHSGQPFNVLTGFDSLGDNHAATHRPFGLGRNVGHGPDYYAADMRISRRFALGREGARSVVLIAEGFNLANRVNFRTLNNVVGTADPALLARVLTGHTGDALSPFAFTSAYNSRQLQVAVKITF